MKEIEPKIKSLVDALNGISYIKTFNSCEGHYDSNDPHEHSAYIFFKIENEEINEKKFENLIELILTEAANEWGRTSAFTSIKKYFSFPVSNKLYHSWVLEIEPRGATLLEKRLGTDEVINKMSTIIKNYCKNSLQ